MTTARNPRIWRAILLTITIFSLSLPAYAKYNGLSIESNRQCTGGALRRDFVRHRTRGTCSHVCRRVPGDQP